MYLTSTSVPVNTILFSGHKSQYNLPNSILDYSLKNNYPSPTKEKSGQWMLSKPLLHFLQIQNHINHSTTTTFLRFSVFLKIINCLCVHGKIHRELWNKSNQKSWENKKEQDPVSTIHHEKWEDGLNDDNNESYTNLLILLPRAEPCGSVALTGFPHRENLGFNPPIPICYWGGGNTLLIQLVMRSIPKTSIIAF